MSIFAWVKNLFGWSESVTKLELPSKPSKEGMQLSFDTIKQYGLSGSGWYGQFQRELTALIDKYGMAEAKWYAGTAATLGHRIAAKKYGWTEFEV